MQCSQKSTNWPSFPPVVSQFNTMSNAGRPFPKEGKLINYTGTGGVQSRPLSIQARRPLQTYLYNILNNILWWKMTIPWKITSDHMAIPLKLFNNGAAEVSVRALSTRATTEQTHLSSSFSSIHSVQVCFSSLSSQFSRQDSSFTCGISPSDCSHRHTSFTNSRRERREKGEAHAHKWSHSSYSSLYSLTHTCYFLLSVTAPSLLLGDSSDLFAQGSPMLCCRLILLFYQLKDLLSVFFFPQAKWGRRAVSHYSS